jgi:hypothetical protein
MPPPIEKETWVAGKQEGQAGSPSYWQLWGTTPSKMRKKFTTLLNIMYSIVSLGSHGSRTDVRSFIRPMDVKICLLLLEAIFQASSFSSSPDSDEPLSISTQILRKLVSLVIWDH